jgi:hypothetical protein
MDRDTRRGIDRERGTATSTELDETDEAEPAGDGKDMRSGQNTDSREAAVTGRGRS